MFDDFIIRAIAAGIGVAVVAAPLGCFIVWRRMAYFGSTIAHSGLLGVALGMLLAIDLTIGVVAVALALSGLLIGLQRQQLLPTDTLLGILAHVALAAGLIAASQVSGGRLDLMGYLFGDILAVTDRDLVWIYGAGAAILGVTMWIWRPLLAVSLHEELAEAEGVNARAVSALFMVLLALTVALAMKLVGILLIASLLIIPAAVARPFSKTPEQMALLAGFISAIAVALGIGASLTADTPAGPSIVMALAVLFTISLVWVFRRNSM